MEALGKRTEREDTQGGEVLNEQALKEVHEQVNDMIKMEKGELEMIQDQCSSDVGTIGEGEGERRGKGRGRGRREDKEEKKGRYEITMEARTHTHR